jgi:hypothetical protein
MPPRHSKSAKSRRRNPSSRVSPLVPSPSGGSGLTPLHQGDLDGLCGVYAVINAFCLLCPEFKERQSRRLFVGLIDVLNTVCLPKGEFLYDGIEVTEVTKLVRFAKLFAKEEFDIRIISRPLKLRRERRRYDELWNTLQTELDTGAVSILALSGYHGHWTVAHRATAKAAYLFDSDELKILRRAACSLDERKTRHWIAPSDVLFLHRTGARAKP